MKKYLSGLFFSVIILAGCTADQQSTATNETNEAEKAKPAAVRTPDLKDSTAASVMSAIFGNYDKATKQSVAELKTIQIEEMKERIFGDYIDEKIVAELVYKTQLKDNRVLVVVAAKPAEAYDCRICAPALGAAILKNKGTDWYMGEFKYFSMAGSYGFAPEFSTKQISGSDYALVEGNGGLHQGYSWSSENYYSINNGFTPLFSVNTYNDNSGTCDPDGKDDSLGPCYENETSVKLIPKENPTEYYDIQTHQKGTDWDFDNEKIITVDEEKYFVYQDGKYVEKAD